ncbi:MAG TPA: hypothetical protein VK963_03245, partial [Candidatus Saccharimonadales bacterium]|nr:hypothetical protein [Candidatus Saccharimonadales bacterium]
IDTTAPTTATVYDRPNGSASSGADTEDNGDGSLTELSARWDAFSDSASGVSKYEHSIGTAAGGTDISGWTDNGLALFKDRASPLTLQTSKTYFFNVRATDVAGNTSAVASSNGQYVTPTLTFDIDVSASDTETSAPYVVAFGDLPVATVTDSPVKVWIDLASNGAGGGKVYLAGQNAGLKSAAANFTIGTVSGDLSALSGGFGAQGATATQGSGGPLAISSPYNVTGQTVGMTDTILRDIFTSSSPITAGRGSFLLKAKSSAVTPASNDYAEILTVIAASTY